MNKMPKFTAEAALYKINEHYHMVKTIDQANGTIYPAQLTQFAENKPIFGSIIFCQAICGRRVGCFNTCINHELGLDA
jgi:hypothetical protein